MPGPVAGLWREGEPLLLASTSAVRRRLLEEAGLPVETEGSGVDERAVETAMAGRPAREVASRLAAEKARAVSSLRPGRLVVGADQVLEAEGRTWPKPETAASARAQIGRLAGRVHHLHSAVAVFRAGAEAAQLFETARMTMRPLSSEAIACYVHAAGEAATRSAGGYEIEGLGIHLFARVEGDTTTVLGLPMLPLLAELRRIGALGW